MRALEGSWSSMSKLIAREGLTYKLLFPPQEFHIANAVITNLHQPESPLFMMACAYTDHKFMTEVYQEAMKEGYRFLCYGDAMLIL